MSNFNKQRETTYQAIVGTILINMRQQLHIEQSLVAKRVGVTPSTWSRVERGESALTVTQLAKAAEAFRVKPSVILSSTEQAREQLEKQGMTVKYDKIIKQQGELQDGSKAEIGVGYAVAGAALGALLTAAFMNNNKDK